ncbi:MAG: methyltransferase domain-containing protein [Neomegalonema sp.]|nr:methyltransferase domain-containing protein [Neomegalonema sp.]
MDHLSVQEYYGETLQSSQDLKTNACCDAEAPPAHIRAILGDIHPEISSRYYGCGLVAPSVLEGARVLDLGCGTGRDVYLLSRLVGPSGHVIGVDMTEAQLAVARGALDWQMARFGFETPNVSLLTGYIEQLAALPIEPESIDVIVSNCVVNLATDKRAVLQGAFDLLKPGGEMFFSDVYADRRIPDELRADPVLYGECLSGALYSGDFLRLAREVGFAEPRRVTSRTLSVDDPEAEAKLGDIRFVSETWRLFKCDDLEGSAEDYGQHVTYRGGVEGEEEQFVLDDGHGFTKGASVRVSGDTFALIKASRFAPYFDFDAGDGLHRGAFANSACCAPKPKATGSSCC